jgi:predicted amidohydrolase/DNA polymerase III delta prime subunit
MRVTIREIDLGCAETPKCARVTLAQTVVANPSLFRPDGYLTVTERTEKSRWIEKQSQEVRKQLQKALLDDPDIVVFPELCIPWQMKDELRRFSEENGVYIIGGLTYGPSYENSCAVFVPFGGREVPLQCKLNKAPGEDTNTKTGSEIIIFRNTGFGDFASVICYDFTSLNISKEIRDKKVSLLFLPTLNHATDLFDDMAHGLCYTMYMYICVCNSAGAGYGNSGSYGPVRAIEGATLRRERVIGQVGGTQETVLTVVVNVPSLLESIDSFKKNRPIPIGYITPPADFCEKGAVVSPYTPLAPARDNFVAREKEIGQTWALLESRNHVLILGPSGTGKTSLMYHLQAERPYEFQTGFVEVFDSEDTFHFLRRLTVETISRTETERKNIKFEDAVQQALDNINRIHDLVSAHGFEKASMAFIESFHEIAQIVSAERGRRIVIFIDQAERLAWLEEHDEKKPYAIRILIRIMRDLETLEAPIRFVLAIRQHDYDPLIALANDHLPAQVVPLRMFSKDDAVRAVEKPVPLGISVNRDFSDEIADLSNGNPFFVQLLADAAFKQLGDRKVLSRDVLSELAIASKRDLFPLLMKSLTPNEQRYVEAIGMHREYTVRAEDLLATLQVQPSELRHITDMLLAKNVIETLENDRVRFVHDQMKGFVQREWLAAKMSATEKLRTETTTTLQTLMLSREDEISVMFGLPSVALCIFKSLYLGDFENAIDVTSQISELPYSRASDICLAALAAAAQTSSKDAFMKMHATVVSGFERIEAEDLAAEASATFPYLDEGLYLENMRNTITRLEKLLGSLDRHESERAPLGDSWEEYGPICVTMQYLALAADLAHRIRDDRRDIFRNEYRRVLTHTKMLERPQSLVGFACVVRPRPPTEYDFDTYEWTDFVSMERLSFTHGVCEFADWELQTGYERHDIEELLELAYGHAKAAMGKAENKYYDFIRSARDFQRIRQSADKLGDVRLARKCIENELESATSIPTHPPDRYRPEAGLLGLNIDALALAREVGDEKREKELRQKVLDQLSEYEDSKGLTAESCWSLATRLGKEEDEDAKRLCQKALTLTDLSKDPTHSDFLLAARCAEKLQNATLRKEIYENMMRRALQQAKGYEETGRLILAGQSYVAAGRAAEALGDIVAGNTNYEEAEHSLRRAGETYERLNSFLLDRETVSLAQALLGYFSNDSVRSSYFNRIMMISGNCRKAVATATTDLDLVAW